jgi:uncharacterized protein (DUF1697 family)
MQTWIALLRAVNVGGRNTLPMKRWVSLLEELGCNRVRTYIQSGNAVFQCEEKNALRLSDRIGRQIESTFGFLPLVVLVTLPEFERAMAANPFANAESEPKSLHLCFLATPALDADLDGLDNARDPTERWELIDRVFYLHAPNGIGRSKLAARAEKFIGVPLTARNWRSVQKIVELAHG